MRGFLIRWFITTVAVLAAAHLVPGIRYHTAGALLTASLLLGLINAILKPFLMLDTPVLQHPQPGPAQPQGRVIDV